ncbi:MAG: hypothetical protein FWF29_10480, partial [Treponema sp.]|nr:hypothetical protein [Treponema sp.]
IRGMGKKVILISNTVYELTNPPDISTVVVVGTPAGRENLKAAAGLLYGKISASARTPLKREELWGARDGEWVF